MANLIANSQTQQTNSFVLSPGIPTFDQGGKDLGLSQGLTNAPDNGMKFDAFSIRITLVIVFCIIFLVAILVIFIVICLKRKNCIGRTRNQNCRVNNGKSNYRNYDGSSSRPVSNGSDNSFMNENEDYLHGMSYSGNTPMSKVSKKSFELRPHQPDIIEAEIHFVPSYHVYDYAYDHRMYGHTNEHNNQTIQCTKAGAPDINCYRTPHQSLLQSPVSYQEHQEAKRRYFAHRSVELPPQTALSPRISSPEDISSPASGNGNGKYFQNTPLARLTPCSSSELPHHPVRILTLQDISRKQLQSMIIDSTSSSGGVSKEMVHSSSDMSWNNPIVHQSTIWNCVQEMPVDSCGLRATTSTGIQVFNPLDLVSNEVPPLEDQSSSSGSDDSFTGSEFGDEESKDVCSRQQLSNLEKSLQPVPSTSSVCVDSAKTFPDSFSSLITCDGRTSHNLSSSLQSFDCVLNSGFDFESLVDVFQDLADLPDLEHGRPNNNENMTNLSEIYV